MNFNFNEISYQNINFEPVFNVATVKTKVFMQNITSKLFYEIFVQKKFQPPIYQSFLSRTFDIEKMSWRHIYENKVKKMYEKKIAEFNYKLLNNLLCNRAYLQKINRSVSDLCTNCNNSIENNEHLIFQCENVRKIWNFTSLVLKFNVVWKHILIGFYFERNKKINDLNNIISTLATIIYKYKMFCRLKNIEENMHEIEKHVKTSLKYYSLVYKRLNNQYCATIFDKISLLL